MSRALIASAVAGAAAASALVATAPWAADPVRSTTADDGARAQSAAKVRVDSRLPRGPRGPRGARGPAATDLVRSLTINWRNGASGGRDAAGVDVPGVGRLVATCRRGDAKLVLLPARGGVRTVASVTRFESTNSTNATPSSTRADDPVAVADPLPVNGMLSATLSVQPLSGDGGRGPAPATLVATSEMKLNGTTPDEDFCFVAAQVIVSR